MQAVLVAFVGILVSASPALAGFELVSEFGETGESALKDDAAGVAVNFHTGDVYIADWVGNRVERFAKDGQFLEAWGWGVADEAEEFERCGPALFLPECNGTPRNGAGDGEFRSAESVAIDQATGNVYVTSGARAKGVVQVFTAAGEFITSFGDIGTAEPRQIQESNAGGTSLAVDEEGNAYVLDGGETFGPRVMVFSPQTPGDFSSYEYAGRDLLKGTPCIAHARELAADTAGDLYIAKQNAICRFSAANRSVPVCERSGLPLVEAMSVDPVTGDVYFYSDSGNSNRFHTLDANCNPVPEGEFSGVPHGVLVGGMAFNPAASVTGHPPGILYADAGVSTGFTGRGLIYAPAPVELPEVTSLTPSAVGVTEVHLEADINPRQADTHYRFELGTEGPCATTTCEEYPTGGAQVTAAGGPATVSTTIGGLSPETQYFVRVVAVSRFGQAELAGAFRTFPASEPADHRGYELVSPADKHDGEVFPLNPFVGSCSGCEPGEINVPMPMQATPDGTAVVYEGYPFTPSGGAVGENEYRAVRGQTGWHTTDLSPPLAARVGKGYREFSADLSSGVLRQAGLALTPDALQEGYQNLYLQSADGALRPILTTAAVPEHRPVQGENEFSVAYAGGASDLTTVIFEANDSIAGTEPEAPTVGPKENNLFSWSNGQLRLLNILPDGRAEGNAAVGAGDELSVLHEEWLPGLSHAVSSDGSRIFWTDLQTGQLFVRENNTQTQQVPDSGRCLSSLPQESRVCFLDASSDGAEVLLSDGLLYNINDIAAAPFDLSAGLGGFLGVVGASDDLGRIYFVDTSKLTSPGQTNELGASPAAGADNLYLADRTTGEIAFIATLLPQDNKTGIDNLVGDWRPSPSRRDAQVTSDGRYLAFTSTAPVTGFDNRARGGECGEGVGAPCQEIYEYDATSAELTCVSCTPTGLRPTGGSVLSLSLPIGGSLPQPRNLTQDGRVFFDSFDRLSPLDVRPGIENVYEFERNGQGTCLREDGCINMLSSGQSAFDSGFVSASASGSDVFLTTRARLVPEDQDDRVDLYDAREGGGPVALTEPQPCSGEGCRLSSAVPLFPGATSQSFSGPGNLTIPPAGPKRKKRCASNAKLKHGVCVRVKCRKALKHGSRRCTKTRRRGVRTTRTSGPVGSSPTRGARSSR